MQEVPFSIRLAALAVLVVRVLQRQQVLQRRDLLVMSHRYSQMSQMMLLRSASAGLKISGTANVPGQAEESRHPVVEEEGALDFHRRHE